MPLKKLKLTVNHTVQVSQTHQNTLQALKSNANNSAMVTEICLQLYALLQIDAYLLIYVEFLSIQV